MQLGELEVSIQPIEWDQNQVAISLEEYEVRER